MEEKVDEEKTKRVTAEKRIEKLKEKTEQLTVEVQGLQEQLRFSVGSSPAPCLGGKIPSVDEYAKGWGLVYPSPLSM